MFHDVVPGEMVLVEFPLTDAEKAAVRDESGWQRVESENMWVSIDAVSPDGELIVGELQSYPVCVNHLMPGDKITLARSRILGFYDEDD